MKFNPVVWHICKSTWAIHPRLALGYGEYVSMLLSGRAGAGDEREPLKVYAITPSGARVELQPSDEEPQAPMFDGAPEGSVAFIPLKGEMLKEDTMSHFGTESIANVVREAADHKNIRAIIIETDSPGGSVDAVAPLVDAIGYARTKNPVIAWADMAASAAYWSISAADLVIASNDISSEFGSIGVMASFADVRPMWEREGVKFHTIYAPESDFKNQPFEKALTGDYGLIKQEWLSPLARKFQEDVRQARQGKIAITVEGILRGRNFYAQDAVKYGLADAIGNRDYVIKRAVEMAK